MFQRYENESNSQRISFIELLNSDCFWCFKDMKMKAIHNCNLFLAVSYITVSDVSKIWKWKQFTTTKVIKLFTLKLFLMFQRYENESNSQLLLNQYCKNENCFWCFKDMKMKAIHNFLWFSNRKLLTVSDVSKIWKWKQFTTFCLQSYFISNCFWCFKDMKMKAIHNCGKINYKTIWLFLMFQRYENESNSQLLVSLSLFP